MKDISAPATVRQIEGLGQGRSRVTFEVTDCPCFAVIVDDHMTFAKRLNEAGAFEVVVRLKDGATK